jgi:hypothetical protein
LQGIKIHFCEFLYDFALKRNKLPGRMGAWSNSTERSQLTLFEAENLWGPRKLFYQDDNRGYWGGYQPNFPQKWIYDSGKTMFMASSGSFGDYNFTVQRLDIETR